MLTRFAGHAHANAYTITNANGTRLISYYTVVAEITASGDIKVYGLYSATTRKHLGWFAQTLPDYPNGEHVTYHDLKRLYDDGVTMNIYTGEIKPLT